MRQEPQNQQKKFFDAKGMHGVTKTVSVRTWTCSVARLHAKLGLTVAELQNTVADVYNPCQAKPGLTVKISTAKRPTRD